ncbi:MAG TPA: M50 family metallopeptidase [Acidobacteriaceae bacterium]|nr:M50 family metallopeptidase [Acidobacteriaceae bacterium]
MIELRKYLGGIFALAAIILIWGAITSIRISSRPPDGPHSVLDQLVVYLGLAAFLGYAAWSIFANKRFARILGLIASVLPLLGLFALIALLRFRQHSSIELHGIPWIALALAVAGVVAFAPKHRNSQAAAKTSAPIPIPGDGTHPLLNKSIWIIGAVLFLVFEREWLQWAALNDLSIGSEFLFLVQLVLAELATVLCHELGHALTGLALGMRLRAFIVGPFQWRIQDGAWEFRINPRGFFSTGGATALVPTDPHEPSWRRMVMIAGGPMGSLFAGMTAAVCALTSLGYPWEQTWPFTTGVATFSLLAAMLNLIPFQTGDSYSDGALLYQLMSDGMWADYHHAISVVGSSLVTPLRPRDYDIAAIDRCALSITRGTRAMLLHLHASSYYLDHGQVSQAAHAFAQAETICHESVPNLSVDLHAPFVFRKAYLQRDAAGARQWWERMEAKKPTRFKVDYWLAAAALHWIEGRLDEARSAWNKANAFSRQLPSAGAYEFDRYRCELLKKAIYELPADDPLATSTGVLSPGVGSSMRPA